MCRLPMEICLLVSLNTGTGPLENRVCTQHLTQEAFLHFSSLLHDTPCSNTISLREYTIRRRSICGQTFIRKSEYEL